MKLKLVSPTLSLCGLVSVLGWAYQSIAEVLSHTVGFYLLDDDISPNASKSVVAKLLHASDTSIVEHGTSFDMPAYSIRPAQLFLEVEHV